MDDEGVRECYECRAPFTTFRRKHHCRVCGLIFCGQCAPSLMAGHERDLAGMGVRVCGFCLEAAGQDLAPTSRPMTSPPSPRLPQAPGAVRNHPLEVEAEGPEWAATSAKAGNLAPHHGRGSTRKAGLALQPAWAAHLERVTTQALSLHQLPTSLWSPILARLLSEACPPANEMMQPGARMIKVKCIPSGFPAQSHVVEGGCVCVRLCVHDLYS
jgi:hypothetical protein